MPVYEYECGEHGLFELIRNISESSEPAPCPDCSLPGARVLSAPHLSVMPRSQILARDRNERSRHEPRISKSPHAHEHHVTRGPAQKPQPLQAYHGRRPWVIEHG
jgi:putative FmdB family regulatory protein